MLTKAKIKTFHDHAEISMESENFSGRITLEKELKEKKMRETKTKPMSKNTSKLLTKSTKSF